MDVNLHVELLANDPLRQPFHNRQTEQPELEVADISVNCTNHVEPQELQSRFMSVPPSTRNGSDDLEAPHCQRSLSRDAQSCLAACLLHGAGCQGSVDESINQT